VSTARDAGVGIEGGGEGRVANHSEHPGRWSAMQRRVDS
jgi:hypothetical protein